MLFMKSPAAIIAASEAKKARLFCPDSQSFDAATWEANFTK